MTEQDSQDALEFYLSEEEFRFQQWKEKVENISGEQLEKFKQWEKQF